MSKDKVVQMVNKGKEGSEAPKGLFNFHITLNTFAQMEAKEQIHQRGLEVRENWDGPLFEDILGYQIGGEWVAVSLKDGCTYVYPKSSIARLKHFPKTE